MTPPAADPPARWRYALLERGPCLADFWHSHLAERKRDVLLIVGRGFDPRMCHGPRLLFEAGGDGRRDVHALHFSDDDTQLRGEQLALVTSNWAGLQAVVGRRGQVTERRVNPRNEDGRRVGPSNAANLYSSHTQISGYTDIVVDVSSIPRGLYFPLLARLLHLIDRAEQPHAINLHILAADDPELDARIREEGVDESADFLFSFEGRFTQEATAEYPRVWIPLLGEGRVTQFDRLYDLIKPDEIAPVIPSPSRNPRRGDAILTEYRALLFDQLRIDPRNIFYASEGNPFDVYRQIRQAVLHYHRVLSLLGGCKVAISVLSSKVMSVGAFLVAYEFRLPTFNVGVAHIDSQRYTLASQDHNPELLGMWLAGECYGT